jgi:hypothetical protein
MQDVLSKSRNHRQQLSGPHFDNEGYLHPYKSIFRLLA